MCWTDRFVVWNQTLVRKIYGNRQLYCASEHRSKGIGKMLTDYVNQKAIALDCTMIVLDAYTQNFTAHRFYYNQGYYPRGFHFVKTLNVDGLT